MIQRRTRRSKIYSVSSRDSSPVVSRTGPIALVPARLNYPLGYPGYREELGSPRYRGERGYPRYQIHPYIVDADYYIIITARIFGQDLGLQDQKLNPILETLYRQLSTYPL